MGWRDSAVGVSYTLLGFGVWVWGMVLAPNKVWG